MALAKQGVGGDNLSVAWQPPGTTFDTTNGAPIPGAYLAPVAVNADLTPPAAPANLRATLAGNNTQVALSWSPVPDLTSGIDHYVIYRDGQAYATSTTASYTDSGNISSQNRHTYQVAAVNFDGVTGAQSAALSIAPVGIASIGTPTHDERGRRFHGACRFGLGTNRRELPDQRGLDLVGRPSIRRSHRAADDFRSRLGQPFAFDQQRVRPRGAALPALAGNFSYASSAWAVTVYEGNGNVSGTLSSLAQAQLLVNTPGQQAWVRTDVPQVINYATGGAGQGQYIADNGLPGQLVTDNVLNYALTATGQIYIPAAGTYTFDCNSDDGFSVTISGANFISGHERHQRRRQLVRLRRQPRLDRFARCRHISGRWLLPLELALLSRRRPVGRRTLGCGRKPISFQRQPVSSSRRYGQRRTGAWRHGVARSVHRRRHAAVHQRSHPGDFRNRRHPVGQSDDPRQRRLLCGDEQQRRLVFARGRHFRAARQRRLRCFGGRVEFQRASGL